MQEIVEGIYRWTAPHPEWRTRIDWGHEVACFALADGGRLILIDPLLPTDERREAVLAVLDGLASDADRVDVTITVPYHARSAEELYRRYHTQAETAIWGHQAVARRFHHADTPLQVIEPGATIAAGAATAFAIGKPRRHEMPLFFPAQRALAFGDAVIGIDGRLRVWEQASSDPVWFEQRFVPTLRPLLDVDVERVLVTHGPPILHDGRRALEDALAAGRWDYRTSGTA